MPAKLPLRRTLPVAAIVVMLSVALAPGAHARQNGSSSHSSPAAPPATVHAAADSAYYGGRPEEAWDALQVHLERVPDDYEALWRAARSALVIAVATEGNREQNAWLDPGRNLAGRAVELRPDGIEGLYFRAALTGRRAMNASPGYAVELAQRTYDDAHRILEMDPEHGGAHNALGKLHYEVMSLSWLQRLVARTFMGSELLHEATWDEAEHHLAEAERHSPEVVVFHYDLAALYRKRGREEEARVELGHALELPVLHPPDARFKEQAGALLAEIGG